MLLQGKESDDVVTTIGYGDLYSLFVCPYVDSLAKREEAPNNYAKAFQFPRTKGDASSTDSGGGIIDPSFGVATPRFCR